MMFVKGNLTIHSLPFTDQPGYDRLLWACDLNCARGEDSLVRALWAGAPLLWQIYPQDGDIHLGKLKAFLAVYSARLGPAAREALDFAHVMWNQSARQWPEAAKRLLAHRAELQAHADAWAASHIKETDLAHRLLATAGLASAEEN